MEFGEFIGTCSVYVLGLVVFGYGAGVRGRAAKWSGRRIMLVGIGIAVLAVAVAGILTFLIGGVVMAALVFGNVPAAYCGWLAYKVARHRTAPPPHQPLSAVGTGEMYQD